MANGKLWNYNLQYFNFLSEEGLPDREKEELLLDIAVWLDDGRLKLEPYPVSLRVMNTIRFLSRIRPKASKIVEDCFAQLNYLRGHFEYHLLANHLLENAFALFMGGHAFRQTDWQEKGKEVLLSELNEQVLDDGAHFELSPMYHQVILYRLLELADWYGKQPGHDQHFLDFVRMKVTAMTGWLQSISFENGDIPNLNDSADEVAFDTKHLLRFARSLRLGSDLPSPLKDSGYRKYSFGRYECVVDVAELGPSYQPGHAHADALSFILYQDREPLIVEAGTSTYEAGTRRAYERSTGAHNTVVLNDRNQSELWGSFRVGRRASVSIHKDTGSQLSAAHDGYYHKLGVTHKREFVFSVDRIVIDDHIGQGAGKLLLHFHPGCEVELMQEGFLIPGRVRVNFENARVIALSDYEFAAGFNRYRKAKKVEVQFEGSMRTIIQFV